MWKAGRLEGPPSSEVFGLISDIAVDEDASVFVLDRRRNQITMFDEHGNVQASAGSPGAGPGEFRAPWALAVGPRDTLFVADRDGRISKFHVTADSLRFESVFTVPFEPEDVCLMGDAVYLQGTSPAADGMIHKYSRDGVLEASFGAMFASDNPIVSEAKSRGLLHCLQEATLVVEVPRILPVVRVYEAHGHLLWSDSLPGYRPVQIEGYYKEGHPGANFEVATPLGTHRAIELHHPASNLLAIQLAMQDTSAASPNDIVNVVTHFFHLDARRYLGQTNQMPRLADGAQTTWIGFSQLPYPELVAYEINTLFWDHVVAPGDGS